MESIFIKVSEEFKTLLKVQAALRKTTMTDLIQIAVKEYIKNNS